MFTVTSLSRLHVQARPTGELNVPQGTLCLFPTSPCLVGVLAQNLCDPAYFPDLLGLGPSRVPLRTQAGSLVSCWAAQPAWLSVGVGVLAATSSALSLIKPAPSPFPSPGRRWDPYGCHCTSFRCRGS